MNFVSVHQIVVFGQKSFTVMTQVADDELFNWRWGLVLLKLPQCPPGSRVLPLIWDNTVQVVPVLFGIPLEFLMG